MASPSPFSHVFVVPVPSPAAFRARVAAGRVADPAVLHAYLKDGGDSPRNEARRAARVLAAVAARLDAAGRLDAAVLRARYDVSVLDADEASRGGHGQGGVVPPPRGKEREEARHGHNRLALWYGDEAVHHAGYAVHREGEAIHHAGEVVHPAVETVHHEGDDAHHAGEAVPAADTPDGPVTQAAPDGLDDASVIEGEHGQDAAPAYPVLPIQDAPEPNAPPQNGAAPPAAPGDVGTAYARLATKYQRLLAHFRALAARQRADVVGGLWTVERLRAEVGERRVLDNKAKKPEWQAACLEVLDEEHAEWLTDDEGEKDDGDCF